MHRTMTGWQRLLAVVVAAATVSAVLPVAAAEAVTVRRHSAERILGGITAERLEIRTSDGTARGDLLRFREDDPAIDLRPRLARNTVAGTEGMLPLARRELSRGAVAGVNGGYWLSRPWGAPNGLFVDRGRLLAGQAVRNNTGGGPTGRGMVGWRQHGRPVMDLLTVTLTLTQPARGTLPVEIDELNRQPLTSIGVVRPGGELLLFTDRFGTGVNVPDGSLLVAVEGVRLGSSGTVTGRVLGTRTVDRATTVSVPEGQQLLVAYDARRDDLLLPVPGEELLVTSSLAPAATSPSSWEGLWGGVAGGQLLVRDGRRRSVDEWRQAAAFSDSHATSPQPRTVIARHRDGEVWLVTIDGRRSGWSVGITLRDLADALVGLGVTEAVNLDGGGSTTMTVGGEIRNRPSESGRTIADGLFLYVAQPPASRSLASACTPEVQQVGAAFTDVVGTTHAAAISCLAGWGVTSGVTATTFAPSARVTRGQMASFLARWIDDHAARGEGQPLPDAEPVTFADVAPGNVHAEAIGRLAAAGIVTGRTPDRFEPGAPVTRAQTATMVTQAAAQVLGRSLPAGRDTFIDDNGSTHEANIDRLAGVGIATGVGGFDFGPATPVSRGAMASLLMRATALLVDEGVAVLPGEGPVLTAVEQDAEPGADEDTEVAGDEDASAATEDAEPATTEDTSTATGEGGSTPVDDTGDQPEDGQRGPDEPRRDTPTDEPVDGSADDASRDEDPGPDDEAATAREDGREPGSEGEDGEAEAGGSPSDEGTPDDPGA